MATRISALPKYVVSKTLADSEWQNTTVLRGDLETEIRRLKDQPGGELLVYGSADLVGRLLELDLVDELRDRKSTRLNSSHLGISYAVFCLKKKKHTR